MRVTLIFFLIFLVHPCKSVREVEYCCIFCPRGTVHTVCKYPKGGFGKDCKGRVRGTLNDANRSSLLTKHNKLRQLVANGKIKEQPAAANLLEMIWDYELEFIAKRWNDQCIFAHDSCRNSLRFSVGQNIAYGAGQAIMSEESFVQQWFNEYADTPPDYIDKMTKIDVKVTVNGTETMKQTGHFTQLVWAKSYRLGCSVTIQFEKPFYKNTLMCDYGPGGNVINREVYKRGKGCSACPEGTECSKVYPGLCALKCSKLYPFFCSGSGRAIPFFGSGRAIPFFGKFILTLLFYNTLCLYYTLLKKYDIV